MSLATRLVRNSRALLRSAAIGGQFGDSSILPNSMMAGIWPGTLITTEQGALQIATALNCARVLSDDVSTLPFAAYTGDKFGVKRPMLTQPQIVSNPFGRDVTPAAGMGQIATSVKLRGNAYLWVDETDAHGDPTQVHVMHPDRVKVLEVDGQKRFKVGSDGTLYDTQQIRHITGFMLPGWLYGIDPLSLMRITMQMATDVAQYGLNFFANGGSPSGVIEVPMQITKADARRIKEVYEAGHQGVQNAHRVGIVDGGAKFTALSISPENAQFLQTRAFLREEISGWFGVPLDRINAAYHTRVPGQGGGMETSDTSYAKNTLLPLTAAIEATWNDMIPGGDRTWCLFDYSGRLRVSPLERAQIAQVHRVTAVRNPNEIRAEEGWAPYDGGESYEMPLNSNTSGTPAGNHYDPSVNDGQDGQTTPGITGGDV